MRNIIVLILIIFLLIFSFQTEPIDNTIDSIAGATNESYGPKTDSIAGASYDFDEEEDDE